MRRLLLPSWVGSSSTVAEHCSSTASCNCGLVQDTKHWLLRESCAAIVVDCYRSPQNNHNRKIMDEIHLGNTTIELPLVSGEKIQLELMVVIKHFGNTPGGGHYMCFVGEKRRGIQRKIWWCINDSFPIKLMERRRPQQTRTENDYQQLDEGRLNELTAFIYCRTGTNPAWE